MSTLPLQCCSVPWVVIAGLQNATEHVPEGASGTTSDGGRNLHLSQYSHGSHPSRAHLDPRLCHSLCQQGAAQHSLQVSL